MKAAQTFRSHLLPKKFRGKRTIRECSTSGKSNNIVLIELDCDDIGDVIILDVPESFEEKFRKKPEDHVIEIDDDEEVDDGVDVRDGVCDDNDATTSKKSSPPSAAPSASHANIYRDATTTSRYPSTSAARSSNCADVDEDCVFVSEGNTPVKLSKSKRTYSGKSIPGTRYGLSSDSESDSSDSEFMESSFEKFHEQCEKFPFTRRHEANCGQSDSEERAGTTTSYCSVRGSHEEGTTEHCEPGSRQNKRHAQKVAEQSNLSRHNHNAYNMDGLFTRGQGSVGDSSYRENTGGTCVPDQHVDHAAEHVELSSEGLCFKNSVHHDRDGLFGNFPEPPAEHNKYSEQDHDAWEKEKVITGDFSADMAEGSHHQDFESDNSAFIDRDGGAERPTVLSNNTSGDFGLAEPPLDQNNIITDREKMKETDEYKRAMEEEWASRQQQLQRQAEEAQRLRNRKRAEKMRTMDNERRQKQRLEEIRETRRKDEENLYIKEKLRVDIKKELRNLETSCGDMASLLRSLGINVGGGFFPSPNEVQSAYKRACLKFHPDRLTTTDLRQQVEAEEKFKLISHMKEKFLLK